MNRLASLAWSVMFLSVAVGCGSDATTPETPNPSPWIQSLTPDEFEDGGPGGVLLVQGTGFISESEVQLDQVSKATTFVSSTHLRVELTPGDVAVPRAVEVQVFNPTPGGGTSNVAELSIGPSIFLSALEPSEILAGGPNASFRVWGRGFTTATKIFLSGEQAPTTFLGADELRVDLVEEDLTAAGSISITVKGPPPEERESNALTLELLNPVPEVLLLPSNGAHTGGIGFTLTIHGSWFTESSVARWNGQDRVTQYLGRTRLGVTVPASDLEAPGSVEIGVYNPPPAGGSSVPQTLEVRELSVGPGSTIRVPVAARDLVYDTQRGNIYISVQSTDPPHANGVAEVNPFTGEILRSAFVGSDPTRLALSDDGEYLYVGLDGANAVRRLHLPTFTPDLQWALPPGQVAGDIEVVPGQNQSVAVSRHRPGYSPPLEGVTLYEDGVERPVSSPRHTGGTRIAFLNSPDTLYGLNLGFPSTLIKISVESDGLRHATSVRELFHGGLIDMVGVSGRLYGTDGAVVDPEQFQKVANFPIGAWGLGVAADPDLGRAFIVEEGEIEIFDLNNFQKLRTLTSPTFGWVMPHPTERIRHLVRWGEDGLAFLDTDELFIIRNPAFGK